jgi:hypothetical protein
LSAEFLCKNACVLKEAALREADRDEMTQAATNEEIKQKKTIEPRPSGKLEAATDFPAAFKRSPSEFFFEANSEKDLVRMFHDLRKILQFNNSNLESFLSLLICL